MDIMKSKSFNNVIVSTPWSIGLQEPVFHMRPWHQTGLGPADPKVGSTLIIKFKHKDAERVTARSFVIKEVIVEWNEEHCSEPTQEEVQKWVDGKFHKSVT